MRLPFRTISGTLAALFLLFLPSALHSQEASPAEREIWAQEVRYWNDVKALDVADFLRLWHDDFKGWPATSDKPIPRDSAANMIRDPLARGSRMTEYTLHPKVVQVYGRTAIAIYAVTFTWVDKRGSVERTGQWYKLIHAWLRVGNE